MELFAIKLAALKTNIILRHEMPNVSFRERNFLLHSLPQLLKPWVHHSRNLFGYDGTLSP